ncbi:MULTISPECIES: AraC family transcriptional regulator [Paenibacillus]|uniref:helix-turn-helix transcriptional regulator n=1 Tax=Paenibacillus TaxID=44249 RepID=UPI0003E2001E|nr:MULTISPECIES: AraC family transcriptional regulator [Paenibacillus]ETT36175.1 AraC family transcriptional regulator [Paenibacillus sp. FSL R5-192]MCP1427063.1 AraC-like DNA-binding protein [Paenibacillus xylanexedens]
MTSIFYVECDAVHQNHFVFDIPEGHDAWLLVITQTPAQFWVDGQLKEYPAHCAVLFKPYQKIYYRACSERYINDWIRFESDEPFVTDTSLPPGTPFPLDDPEYCHKLFQLLVAEHSFQNDYRESSINCLLRTLFNKLLESCVQEDISPQHYPLLKLRTAIHNDPSHPWTISEMAKIINVSPGYLQLMYKKSFGLSCMEDVIHSRIRLAKEYLRHHLYTVAEIADRCGYRNVEHFCRQFKQMTGSSPKQFHKRREGVPADLTELGYKSHF